MNEKEQLLINSIYRFARKVLLYRFLGMVSVLSVILLVFWLSVTFADHLFYFSEISRWGLLLIHTTFVVVLFTIFFFKPLRSFLILKKNSDLSSFAREIGQKYLDNDDELVNIYHLITRPGMPGISDELKAAAIKKVCDKYREIDYAARLHIKNYLLSVKILIFSLIGAIALIASQHEIIIHSSKRLLNPANEYLQIPPYTFVVQPGNTRIIQGKKIEFLVRYKGPVLARCQLILDTKKHIQVLPLKKRADGFYGELKDIQHSFTYKIRGTPLYARELDNRINSETYHVKVLIPPYTKNLDIELIPPAYTRLPLRTLDRNLGDIAALAGTKVKVKFETNKPLHSAKIVFSSGKQKDFRVRGQFVSGDFIVLQNDSYHFVLADTGGLNNLNPIEYRVALLPDLPPLVEISEPGQDLELQLDVTLPVKIEVQDDYGIINAGLSYQILRPDTSVDTSWRTVMVRQSDGGLLHRTYDYLWDFNLLPITFEDEIRYFAWAKDNRPGKKSGIGKSLVYSIRFPSLDQFFDTFSQQQEENIDEMEKVSKESQKLKKKLEEINRELKRAKELDWEKKQQVQQALEKQKELQKKLDEIQKNLEEMVQKLDENNLISEELLQKYQQLQELFRQVATPELLEALEKLQNALEKNNPQEVKKAFENFKLNQEIFKESIERTMELLKQVQFEQKMDRLIQQAKNITEQQQKINEQLTDSLSLQNTEERSRLEEMQKQQKGNLDNLKNALERFQQEPRLQKYPGLKEELEKAHNKLNDSSLQQQLQKIQKQISNADQEAAMGTSQKLSQNFEDIQNSLEQAGAQMKKQNKMEIMRKMASAMNRMLKLSHQQEQIQRQTKKASPLGDGLKDVERKQGRVQENFQKIIGDIVALSKETFFINPSMSKSLNQAYKNMQNSLNQLSERNKSSAMRSQQQAMSALNQGVEQMHQALSQLSQAESGTGFQQFMEQMQKMAGRQGQLNEQTLSLFQGQGNSGQLTLAQQGQMQRLAAEQQAIREALQQMQDQGGERSDVLGRLDGMAKQMDEVIQDLLKYNVDRKTIERQRKILSRMLDAQKSLEQRKQSKKRKAQQAKKYLTKDPGKIKHSRDDQREALQQALRRALEEGYTADYQKLIERYFKELLKDSKEEKQESIKR